MSFVPEPTPGGPTEIFLLTIPSRHSIRASSTPAPELPVVARSPMTVSSDRVGFLGPQPEKGRETRLLPPEWHNDRFARIRRPFANRHSAWPRRQRGGSDQFRRE